ncbi:MAG: acyl carrier protein [Ancylobacter novellus]|uniref:Acyl carrier protein n=1 Tax=Ancylobacter novellus TaxID=921 RepID=A0A2W5MG49_ANCNO|nr:MAG: acyl carrier protein [Ancylobacter novellus]
MAPVEEQSRDAQGAVVAGVIEVIRPYVKSDAVTLDSGARLDAIGIDSFDLVEIIFAVEEKFGVEVDYNINSTYTHLATIGDLAREVAKLAAAKKAT